MSVKLPNENGERIRAQRGEQELLLSWGQGVGYEKKADVEGGGCTFGEFWGQSNGDQQGPTVFAP